MDNFELVVDLGNDAFAGEDGRDEVARVLREVSEQVENGWDEGVVRDSNGNRVGSWSITYAEGE